MKIEIPKNITFSPHDVIFYDSGCRLCSRSIEFVKRNEAGNDRKYVALNSPVYEDIFNNEWNLELKTDSIIYMKDNIAYLQSDAVLEIIRDLKRWRFLYYVIKVIPYKLRDSVYDFVARNRGRFFPKI